MWILILTLQYYGTAASSMTTAEFNDAKACDMARDAWIANHRQGQATAFCFPKSSTIPERKQ